MSPKRGQGEGTIGKRSDGRWAARISDGWKNGKRLRRWVYGKTRGEVAGKLAKLQRDQNTGILTTPARVTVAQFLEQWLTDSAKPRLRPKTYASYRQITRLHIEPYIGHIRIKELSPQHLRRWINTLSAEGWRRKRTKADEAANRPEKRGIAPRTIQYARAILRAALQQAVADRHIEWNVATHVKPPRMTKRQIKPLEPDQARRLIAAAESHRLGALITVAVALGLRQGEALGLQWADVDLDKSTLYVRHALQRNGGTWKLVEPKSERSRRTVALPRVVIGALKAHRTAQLEERLAAGENWTDFGFVFCTRTGSPIDPSNAKRIFRALLKAADAPTIRFHDLRHTAASLLIAQGVNARAVAEILGHSSVTLTLNTYAHQLETLKHDAARRMDDILEG